MACQASYLPTFPMDVKKCFPVRIKLSWVKRPYRQQDLPCADCTVPYV
jgi:hypothetical protein